LKIFKILILLKKDEYLIIHAIIP